jgi:hypothetical protein
MDGAFIAMVNTSAFFGYGSRGSALRQLSSGLSATNAETEVLYELISLSTDSVFAQAYHLAMATLGRTLERFKDVNILPHVHVVLAFLSSIASIPYYNNVLLRFVPWDKICAFLNALLESTKQEQVISETIFLDKDRPLPEDFLMRGQFWSQWYLTDTHLARIQGMENWNCELPSMTEERKSRIKRVGYLLAKVSTLIELQCRSNLSSAHPFYFI